MKIERVGSETIRTLRHKVLRKNKPFSTTSYNRDKEKDTIHLACVEKNIVVVCATFYPEKTNRIDSKNAYRLRGMATDKNHRRKGYGKKIMEQSFIELTNKKCDLLWCNARIKALEFYKSIGFKTKGEKFNIGDIGDHYYMYKRII
tara:strand:+ start:70 stop:507 length:438 start_codon:yes stop_codon:yes gene_type:complete